IPPKHSATETVLLFDDSDVEKRRALESGCGQDSERYRIDMGATPPAKPKTTSDV
ncbi:MAG: hypothetical protein QOD93_6070, partial [Acetobacteraceae bacterium]|nr:hypothetical protein [Acetobacteraceae bacterium]